MLVEAIKEGFDGSRRRAGTRFEWPDNKPMPDWVVCVDAEPSATAATQKPRLRPGPKPKPKPEPVVITETQTYGDLARIEAARNAPPVDERE